MNGLRDEERILEELRRIAATVDPVPELVLETARATLGLRRLDAELIELVRDSAEDASGLVTVRGAGDVRMLSFEFSKLAVEMQVTERGAMRDLVAHVSGMDLASALLEAESSRHDVAVDDGVLVIDQVASGLVRLHLTTSDGRAYATSWVHV